MVHQVDVETRPTKRKVILHFLSEFTYDELIRKLRESKDPELVNIGELILTADERAINSPTKYGSKKGVAKNKYGRK